MKISKLIKITLILNFIVTGVSFPVKAGKLKNSRDREVTMANIELAEIYLKKATKANNVWRDTETMIKSAKQTAENQDFAAARNLAMEALYQAELAIVQARKQKMLEFPDYLK